jgi:flagellar FliJ protein
MSAALHILLEQAEVERDAALARLLQADEASREAFLKAEQLQDYRNDYRRRAPALNGRGASIELLRCHQGFMQRLDQAIDQHRAHLHRLQQHAATLRQALMEREVRLAAVKKLIERRAQEQQRLHVRAEQRQSDEAAMRLLQARHKGHGRAGPTQHGDFQDTANGPGGLRAPRH